MDPETPETPDVAAVIARASGRGYKNAERILRALDRAGYVVTLRVPPDYWPHRGAVNGLHLPDPGGINVGRDGRPIR